MSQSIASIIRSIPDSELARIRVARTNGEPVHLDCIYKEAVAPGFFLVFPPDAIPEDLDMAHATSISIRSEADPITLSARIEAIHGDRTLELVAHDTIDPASLREYFRVLYKTRIIVTHEPESRESRHRHWRAEGTTIDLSGTGVLGVFPREFENRNNLYLEFELPAIKKSVRCIGHVVRSRRIKKQRFQIALHFDQISRKDRDAIISACFQEQRRQLRERFQPTTSG